MKRQLYTHKKANLKPKEHNEQVTYFFWPHLARFQAREFLP